MIWRALFVALLLGAVPALGQDASSSSSNVSSSEASSSVEPPIPDGLSDTDLELAVRTAYTGASGFATTHGNYFARDGVFAPLHDAIAAELTKANFGTVAVPADATADLAAARVCLSAPGTELRIATNTFGDGVTLVAVTDTRYFAYTYDPHEADDIKVTAAADCMKLN